MYFVALIVGSVIMSILLLTSVCIFWTWDRANREKHFWWLASVAIECLDMVILLVSWRFGLDEYSLECHGFMLGAVLTELVQGFSAFSLIFDLNGSGGALAKRVFFVCLALDVVQTVFYGLAEYNCGGGLAMAIIVPVGLLITFLAELGTIWQLTH